MEQVQKRNPFKSYFLLTKPGIIMGNAITCAGGFALASKGVFQGILFIYAMLGLGLIVASGCVSNNYMDRHADAKMKRTKNRPLVRGEITPNKALIFSFFLGMTGLFILVSFVNVLTAIVALFGLVVYLLFYSILKYKTVYGTLIGSIAGAVPPVVGYTAVSATINQEALLLFFLIACWQMPHFYAISLYRINDYAAALIPVLPIRKGIVKTKVHMAAFIILFMGICTYLVYSKILGNSFLVATSILSLIWFQYSLRGFSCKSTSIWARKMFIISLFVVTGTCIMIPMSFFSSI